MVRVLKRREKNMSNKPDHKHEGLEVGITISLIWLLFLSLIVVGNVIGAGNRLDRIENHINLCPLKTESFLEEQGLTCDDLIRQGEDK